jgi:16S rRNA (guanine966-N2)-methyltransferase
MMCGVIRENLRLCGFEERASVHRLTAEAALRRLEGPYTLVLADPPYYDDAAAATVDAIASSRLISDGGVLVYEHHRNVEVRASIDAMALYRSRRHGDTVVSIYERRADDEEERL